MNELALNEEIEKKQREIEGLMAEIEETLKRISQTEEVDRILIIKAIENEDSIDSIIMRSLNSKKKPEDKDETAIEDLYAKVIPFSPFFFASSTQ